MWNTFSNMLSARMNRRTPVENLATGAGGFTRIGNLLFRNGGASGFMKGTAGSSPHPALAGRYGDGGGSVAGASALDPDPWGTVSAMKARRMGETQADIDRQRLENQYELQKKYGQLAPSFEDRLRIENQYGLAKRQGEMDQNLNYSDKNYMQDWRNKSDFPMPMDYQTAERIFSGVAGMSHQGGIADPNEEKNQKLAPRRYTDDEILNMEGW